MAGANLIATGGAGVVWPTALAQFPTHYTAAVPAPTPNYRVTLHFTILTVDASLVTVDARVVSDVTLSIPDRYTLKTRPSDGRLQLQKVITNVESNLATVTIGALTAGAHVMDIEVSGTTISSHLDGAHLLTATDATLAAPGFAGCGVTGQNTQPTGTGIRIDHITARPIA